MHERMSSVIELRFDFNDREPQDLEQINRLLATGRWKVRSLDWDDEIPVAKLVRNKR